jgi:hypothetical protein
MKVEYKKAYTEWYYIVKLQIILSLYHTCSVSNDYTLDFKK